MKPKLNENPHRILIVDDNPAIHNDFRKILCGKYADLPDIEDFDAEQPAELESDSPIQFRIDSAYQGLKSVEMVSKAYKEGDPYSLAFVDMRMPPGQDGLATIEQMWKVSPKLQVVICTAFTDHSWNEIHERLGFTDSLLILKKPFDDLEVLQLAVSLTRKYDISLQAEMKQEQLEALVQERTTELEFAALHDGLTGLANREKFNKEIEKVLHDEGSKIQTAVILLDLDQFKCINDTLGHPTGDRVIAGVGQRLASLDQEDLFVARIGGDEFAILCRFHSREHLSSIIDKIQKSVSEPLLFKNQSVAVESSMGISIAIRDGLTSSELIKNADIALYQAKANGRKHFKFFDLEMQEELLARADLESRLRRAVKNEEMELYFQPIFRADSLELCTLEALIRWHDGEQGIVMPGEFIPLAEENGIILQIGEWVLSKACRIASSLPDHVRVAVNVSARQFKNGDLPQLVCQNILRNSIEPNQLELEITETILLSDCAAALDQLHEIRELGVRIVLDDFGTGYSSLSYLRKFNFDKLKVDKAFIEDLNEPDVLAILKTISDLAKALHVETTAEGIETQEQLQQVADLDFTQVQGYLTGRPAPIDEILSTYVQKEAAKNRLSSGTIRSA